MRRQFFISLLASAGLALVVGGLVAAVLTNRQAQRDDIAELSRQAEQIGRQAEEAIQAAGSRPGNPGLRGVLNERTLGELLRTASRIGGHDFVEIAAIRQGELIVPDNSVLIPTLEIDESKFRGGGSQELEGEVNGQPVTVVARGIDTGTPALSLVVFLGRETSLIGGITLIRAFLVALGGAMILVAVLAGYLAKRLGDRLGKVTSAAQAVAGGDLTARVEDDGDDEVAHLAENFNQMAERLEAASVRERDFLMNVGHDLRTPLTSIAGYAETLADGSIPEQDLPRVAGTLQRQTKRLSRLVEDLMLLSRLQAREFSLRVEDVDLSAHVRGIVEDFRPRADAAAVRLEIEVDPVGTVSVDPVRVDQVVSNLLENALRYAPEGGRVSVGVTGGNGTVMITVADTGPGIDPEDLPRVFERLYVAQRYRPVRPEGSGLGLTIVNELVTAMDGTATVTSSPAAGTTVTVELPR